MDVYSREKRSEVMSKVRSSNTGLEMAVRRKLHSLGFRYRLHGKDLPGKPDIVLPKYRSVIFVHGCFWHHHVGCPKSKLPVSNADFWRKKIFRNVQRDEQNIYELERLGWRAVAVWECEVRTGVYVDKLIRFLQRREATNQPKIAD